MLVISKDQMNVFSDFMFGQFKNRMAHNLQENFPEKTSEITDKDLHDLILAGINNAESYGITDEVDIHLIKDINTPNLQQQVNYTIWNYPNLWKYNV